MAPAWYRNTFHPSTLISIAFITVVFYSYFAWVRFHPPSNLECADPNAPPLGSSSGSRTSISNSQILATNVSSANGGFVHFPVGYLPGVEDIVLVIKTGATETYRRLPVHFATTLTQFPNYLLFSDHEEQIAQYKIQDALAEISEGIIKGNEDFELYAEQQKLKELGQSPEYMGLKGGWNLDKYKNIHMTKMTWQQEPLLKWYYFMDTDSYVMLSNLLPYLRDLDHTKRLYMGDAYEINNLKFAQGGTGYVLSHGAIEHVMTEEPDMPKNYEKMAKDSCCGDYVLGEAMKAHGISLSELYPNFCGEGPGRIGFLEKNHCEPVITMHHMLPSEISAMWEFERRNARPDRYILFKDIFDHFVYPHLIEKRDAWDGMSPIHGAVVDLPSDLFQAEGRDLSQQERRDRVWEFCERTCREKGEDECKQFQIQKEECKNFDGVAYGYPVPISREDKDDFKSGWLLDRIQKLHSITCEQPRKGWPKDTIPGS